MILESNNYNKGNSIKEKIDKWLHQDPFPLADTELTMEEDGSIYRNTDRSSLLLYL